MEDYKKKYKEALERAKEYWNSPRTCLDIDKLVEIFPELKESEDERIRKDIIAFIKENYSSAKSWVAWLEKQGKSKSIGKLQLNEDLYEHIRNTCACIDDALSSETLADINDYLSMAGQSAQSAFDMIEKQREKNTADKVEPKSIWHKPDEEPKRDKEVLVEYKSGFHDAGYYAEDEKIFYTGNESAKKDDITRWAYVEDLTQL